MAYNVDGSVERDGKCLGLTCFSALTSSAIFSCNLLQSRRVVSWRIHLTDQRSFGLCRLRQMPRGQEDRGVVLVHTVEFLVSRLNDMLSILNSANKIAPLQTIE